MFYYIFDAANLLTFLINHVLNKLHGQNLYPFKAHLKVISEWHSPMPSRYCKKYLDDTSSNGWSMIFYWSAWMLLLRSYFHVLGIFLFDKIWFFNMWLSKCQIILWNQINPQELRFLITSDSQFCILKKQMAMSIISAWFFNKYIKSTLIWSFCLVCIGPARMSDS